MERKKAVVLLSGGLDSTTVLAIAKSQGFETYALSFNYDQRHHVELKAARKVAKALGVKDHLIVKVDPRILRGSALTTRSIKVPKKRRLAAMSHGIPVTYVPGRNTLFLSHALSFAEGLGSSDIFIGVNALDYSGYPDCRPEFIRAYEKMAKLATKAGVEGKSTLKIHTPLIRLTKAQIIKKGLALGVDFGMTSSCYSPFPTGKPCGQCDSCLLRLKGFSEVGVSDPRT